MNFDRIHLPLIHAQETQQLQQRLRRSKTKLPDMEIDTDHPVYIIILLPGQNHISFRFSILAIEKIHFSVRITGSHIGRFRRAAEHDIPAFRKKVIYLGNVFCPLGCHAANQIPIAGHEVQRAHGKLKDPVVRHPFITYFAVIRKRKRMQKTDRNILLIDIVPGFRKIFTDKAEAAVFRLRSHSAKSRSRQNSAV